MENSNDIPICTEVFKATNLGNKAARGAHLYVMQASDGRIKIGRSGDPHKRRAAMETGNGQRIHLCLVVAGAGHEERRIHAACRAYRQIGEWFQGTREARDAIIAAVGRRVRFPVLLHQRVAPDADAARAETARAFEWLAAQIASEGTKRRKRVPRGAA